jgi:amidase
MSVFSLDASHGNPVTKETLETLCSQLGVSIDDTEKEDYRRLLAVFHDASEQLMAIDGRAKPSSLHVTKKLTLVCRLRASS